MKKKRIVILAIILLSVGLLCLINMSNFYLGSNSMFYRTISDYPNTTWVSKEPQAIIEVTYEHSGESIGIKAIMEVNIDGKTDRYVIRNRVEIFDLFLLDQHGNQISDNINDTNGNVIRTRAKYRKNLLGEVTSFQITAVNDEPIIGGYKTLKFKKEK